MTTFIKKAIPPAIALLLIILLLRQISVQALLDLFNNLSYKWLLVGMGFYTLTNVCRAVRLHVLLPNRTTQVGYLTLISIAQSMFNNILPARTGELSLVYLLYRYQFVPVEEGTLALVIARIFDYFAVAILFVVAALFSLNQLPLRVGYFIVIVMIAMLISIAGVLVLAALRWRSLAFIQTILKRLPGVKDQWIDWFSKKVTQVIQAFEAIHSIRQHGYVFLWSLITWLSTFLWFNAFLFSVGIETTFMLMIVGATFAVLSKAIPFISIGGLGAHEAGWTVGFMLIGFETALAISSGFVVNILTLISSVILGLPGLLLLRWSAKAT